MSFDDKKFGTIFPVRDGVSTGAANERRMLDSIGGSDSFRTRIQNNADGSTTMLRTKNGMPQFTTTQPLSETDSCPDLYMESGVIDLVNTSEAGGGVVGTWFSGVASTATKWLGRVSNKVAHRGELRNNPTIGYSQDSKAVPASSQLKKRVMAAVPASLYTGKMRLYVQSMYGREYVSSTFPLDINAGTVGLAPSLIYHVPVSNGSTDVSLTGNAGIYTDSEYRHWLVGINETQISIMLLICDACTEKLRALLKTISGDEHERIESYILSRSQPSGSPFYIPLTVPTLYQFGYGWHFNWSGAKVDIVQVDSVYNPDGGGIKYQSTHRRITLHRQETVLMVFPNDYEHWSATIEVVESAEWKNRTHSDVISYPDWVYGAQYIHDGHGSRPGNNFGSAAPFYCFYLRDELQVCRYSYMPPVDSSISIADPVTFSPSGNWGMAINYNTHTYKKASRTDWSVSISVGGTELIGNYYSESGFRATGAYVWNGTVDAWDSYPGQAGVTFGYYHSDGYPDVAEDRYHVAVGTVSFSNRADVSLTITKETDYSESASGYVMCVIPFYDAESAYVMKGEGTTATAGGRSESSASGNNVWQYSVREVRDSGVGLIDRSFFGGSNYADMSPTYTSLPDSNPVSTSSYEGDLVCAFGTLPVDVSQVDFSDMKQPADFFGFSQFMVRTSAGKNYVSGFAVPSNLPDFPVWHPSSIVGWV